ncbi:MAG: site-2 protease family protein [Alphaproteobacteria bacterium]|nr:site-2 protease family protein [Alphaproteobacteria bacterium]
MSAPVLLWLLSAPLIAVLHEAGHALAAKPAGYRVTSFGVGHGRPLLRWRSPSGVVFYLGRWVLAGGLCVAIPVDPVPRRRWLYHAGGLVAQGLLALALLPATLDPASPLRMVAAFNLMVLAFNLLPWRLGAYASDGWQLFVERFASGRAGQLYSQRREIERILRYEEQVGATLGVAWCRLMLDWIDVTVGREGPRRPVDEFLIAFDPHVEALDATVSAERHRAEGRPLAGLYVVRRMREAYGARLSDAVDDLLTLSEARCYLDLGEPRMALAALAGVAGVGGVVARDAAVIRVGAALVARQAGTGSLAELEAAAFRLAPRIEGAFLDAPEAARTLWAAAQRLADEGRIAASEVLAARARRAATRMIGAAQLDDRLPIARRLGQVAGVERMPWSRRPRL